MKFLILENIRSAYNVGAIFRTADGAGVEKIFLTGYTPAPTDRFGRVQKEIDKTSLGASRTIEWEQLESSAAMVKVVSELPATVVAIEQTATAMSLTDFVPPRQVAYILGNEITGVSEEAIAAADQSVYIPMLGTKESLNVSVAAGIVLYHKLHA